MADHLKMPVPPGEMTPQQLADRIRDWAASQGYTFTQNSHASEFCLVTVKDPSGEQTWTVIPNAHHGRRIRRHQIRYVVQQLNARWR
jgi:hypothetical protein